MADSTHPGAPPDPARASADAKLTVEHWLGNGQERRGFYIPYRYASGCTARAAPAWLNARLVDAHPRMTRWLHLARRHTSRLAEFAHDTPGGAAHRPRYAQDWFPGLDATLAYVFVRELRPRRIIEIGSGHSTRFMAQAIADGQLQTTLHSIDPAPRKAIDALCSTVTRRPLAEVESSVFDALARDDVLFIDGSHIAMPGTDVEQFAIEILPRLADGVIVHIHDIFLPDPYPPEWAWRGYNEQGLVSALLGTERLQILTANAYICRYQPGWLEGVFCPLESGHPSSLWVRVRGTAGSDQPNTLIAID